MPMSLPVLHLIAAEEATFSSEGTVLYRQERTQILPSAGRGPSAGCVTYFSDHAWRPATHMTGKAATASALTDARALTVPCWAGSVAPP